MVGMFLTKFVEFQPVDLVSNNTSQQLSINVEWNYLGKQIDFESIPRHEFGHIGIGNNGNPHVHGWMFPHRLPEISLLMSSQRHRPIPRSFVSALG